MDRQNPRVNGKSKAIQTKSHTETYTYTLTKREKGKKKKNIYIYIYITAPKVHLLNLGWFIVYSFIPQMQGTSGWLWRFNPLLLRLLGEISLSFLFLFAQLLGFSFGFGPSFACRSPEGIYSSLRQDGVKGAADSGALAHSGQGEGGVWSAGQAWGGRGRREFAPAWGMPCVLPGKLLLDHGALAVVGCTDSWERRCG